MHQAKCDRKSLVINIGGGVIGDMGGFAAATYMRGVDFIQVPTTLLAMVDASVGGKLAIDFDGVKNLIGSFQSPKAVIIDTSFLDTLPERELHSGFAEIIKHGLIADKTYFREVQTYLKYDTDTHPSLRKVPAGLQGEGKVLETGTEDMLRLIHRSVEIKKSIVEADPTEQGIRKILNFGHTIGHAIESHSMAHSLQLTAHSPLLHGEAIAIGMVAEAHIAMQIGQLAANELVQIEEVLSRAQLPTRYRLVDQSIRDLMRSDKKNSHGKIKFALLKGIGECAHDIEVDKIVIDKALAYITGKSTL